jgi:Transcriptional regulator, AbiEi antitoxin
MNAKLAALAERQGGVFSYQDALASGYTASQVRERVRTDRWIRLRRGQYTAIHADPDAPAWQRTADRHRLRTIAAVRSLDGQVAVSHQSAIVAYGLPTWGLDLSTVHVTRCDGQSGRIVKGVVQHQGQLTPGAIWLRDDLHVVAPPRAIIEIACATGFEPALAIADHALHKGLVSRRALEFASCDAVNWPGALLLDRCWISATIDQSLSESPDCAYSWIAKDSRPQCSRLR